MAQRARSVRRARSQRPAPLRGHIVTWDVDSRDRALCASVGRFVLGHEVQKAGRTYRYPGLVARSGVLYLGQSVLFVTADHLAELRTFLRENAVEYHTTVATIGRSL